MRMNLVAVSSAVALSTSPRPARSRASRPPRPTGGVIVTVPDAMSVGWTTASRSTWTTPDDLVQPIDEMKIPRRQ